MFRVTLEACVEGNPLKAWRGETEPDDVWEKKEKSFEDLDEAVAFVADLHEATSTHVVIDYDEGDGSEWRTIFNQDRGDDLDSVTTEVPPLAAEVIDPDAIPAAPPLPQI